MPGLLKVQQRLQKKNVGTTDQDNDDNDNEQEDLTLWQTMMRSRQQQGALAGNETKSVAREDDPIERHRKTKEAMYEKQQTGGLMVIKSVVDTRGDDDNYNEDEDNHKSGKGGKRKGGLWARMRGGKSSLRDEAEPGQPTALSFEFEEAREEAVVTENWSMPDSLSKIINDSAQRTATYRKFGGDPLETIQVEETKNAPVPSSPYHIVVKIAVSTLEMT